MPGHRRIVLIAGPSGPKTGIGRYVYMLQAGLREARVDAVPVALTLPTLPTVTYSLFRLLGRDLRKFLTNYPLWLNYPKADTYHVTEQALASLLLFGRPKGRVVVTIHDIFPYIVRNDPHVGSPYASEHLSYRLPMAGLKRADHLIAVSEYTKQSIIEHLGISSEKISVVYNGIDHERFRPLTVPTAIREKYRLRPECRYLIYVGSEDPRKNLATLIRALAEIRRKMPEVKLVKVGRAHFDRERHRLLDLIRELDLTTAVQFLDDVPEEDLPKIYNLADLCVIPSLYEGFGFPLLEAMACGIPVVYANTGSLPEIAGNAGIPVFPCDVPTLATTITECLKTKSQLAELRLSGQDRAARFSWSATIEKTMAVYENIEGPIVAA